MPEHDYDRLEQFFRKAAAKADVTFNEDDWKKLENRLDAHTSGKTSGNKTGSHVAAVVVTGILLTVSVAVWVGSSTDATVPNKLDQAASIQPEPEDLRSVQPVSPKPNTPDANGADGERTTSDETVPLASLLETVVKSSATTEAVPQADVTTKDSDTKGRSRREGIAELGQPGTDRAANLIEGDGQQPARRADNIQPEKNDQTGKENVHAGDNFQNAQSLRTTNDRLTESRSDSLERNKQKAVVQLPGAEEDETREALAAVQKEHASDNEKHVAAPRLSLLLFFAPDFSGTSMALSSTPGKAFGALLHYHPFERWSIAAGVVKNHKQYTGSGEYYKPPKGYWTRNTNGVVPEIIDGSCDILEFPLMVQYTPILNSKSRWNVGAGLSSYLMQSESYRYHFDQPNPGARDSWDSRGSSRFIFNMLIFTVGYERQVLPGLMLGIEPYAKIPLEEIGWSNLKLFSSGASFTLRYTILQRTKLSVANRSRGPD